MPQKQRRWEKEFGAILKFWDYDTNKNLPNKTAFSNKNVYWKCDKKHTWKASVFDMTQRNWNGCPICNNKKFVNSQRNFAVVYPHLLKEWNFLKNTAINPELINPHCGKKAWWKCKEGHEWEASINGRTKGFGCPYCSGNLPTPQNNLSLYPVAKEFHPVKNGKLKTIELMPASSKKVWWICSKGHEWEGRISDRTGHNSGCPFCHKPYSLLEIRVYAEIISMFPNTTWTAKVDGVEVDVLINDMNIGIEVDGYYWHKDKYTQDGDKTTFLKNKGIKLIRLREKPLKLLNKTDIGYKYTYHQDDYLDLVKKVIARIGIMTNKDISDYLLRSDFANSSLYQKLVSEVSMPSMSVADISPELVIEWHPIRNGNLKPEHVSFGSQQKAWWICSRGHEWKAIVATRIKGHNCPYCSGRYVTDENNLSLKNPELSKQWHPTKNGDLKSSDVSSGSNKKVWWICKEGHEWQAVIASRSNGCNCPVCHEKNRREIAIKASRR